MKRGDNYTVAVRLPVEDYRALKRALNESDYKRMSDLLRAVVHVWVEPWHDDASASK